MAPIPRWVRRISTRTSRCSSGAPGTCSIPPGISPVTGLMRIGTGRDAADVSFATIFGPVRTGMPQRDDQRRRGSRPTASSRRRAPSWPYPRRTEPPDRVRRDGDHAPQWRGRFLPAGFAIDGHVDLDHRCRPRAARDRELAVQRAHALAHAGDAVRQQVVLRVLRDADAVVLDQQRDRVRRSAPRSTLTFLARAYLTMLVSASCRIR